VRPSGPPRSWSVKLLRRIFWGSFSVDDLMGV
jgi:hypothetical protein